MKNKKQFESFFKKVGRDIVFVYKGKSDIVFTKYKDTSVIDTRVKLISGLNHFLRYVYDYRDMEDIEFINEYIITTHFDCVSGASAIVNSKQYDKDLNKLIVSICSITNKRFLGICADYINSTTDCDIDESKATVDMTLTNVHGSCLMLIGLLIKFTYVFSSMIRCDMKYNDTLVLFMEDLTKNAIRAYLKSNSKEYTEDAVDDVSTEIDEFLFKIIGYLWDRKAKTHYKEKFNRIGIDQMLNVKKNKVDVYSSLKKYLPVCINEDVAHEYSSDKNAMSILYWEPCKKYEHFRHKNKALTGYIQRTLKNVVWKQDLNKTLLQDINVTDILINTNEESSLRRDNSLYEDKEGHLLEIRQESAKSLFNMVTDSLMEFEFDLRKELPAFNINDNHTFNQFVLSKILLSLTGEQRVYKEFFGPFAKAILALFYIRLLDDKQFSYMYECIDLMKANGRPNHELYKVWQVEECLGKMDIKVDATIFKGILGVYKNNNGDNFILELDKFATLFKFLESPHRVRHLLFPERFEESNISRSSIVKYSTEREVEFADSLRKLVLEGVY